MVSTQMRLAILGAAAFLVPSLSLAGAQQNPGNVRTIPQDSPDAGVGDNPAATRDKLFLHKAAEGGMAEVQLGQLAAEKGGSDDVKKFGQQMVDDHTKLNAQLQPFADSMGIKPPKKLAKPDQAELAKLSGLSGPDFDKEYISYMVKDHHKDLKDFHDEAGITQNAQLKAAVQGGEKVIKDHTDMADKLAAAH